MDGALLDLLLAIRDADQRAEHNRERAGGSEELRAGLVRVLTVTPRQLQARVRARTIEL